MESREGIDDAGGEPESASTVKKRLWRELAELPVLVVLAFIVAVIVKTFLVQAFYIPSGSMLQTLQVGDRVLVEKVTYRWDEPSRGDVVVFERSVFQGEVERPWHQDARVFMRDLLGLPTGGHEDYIKRVVAVEGDRIRYAGAPRRLVVNGRTVEEPYLRGDDRASAALNAGDCEMLDMARSDHACVVPEGKVFVMGDNRANSEDSRVIGPIDEDKIVGRAFAIIWPPSDIAAL